MVELPSTIFRHLEMAGETPFSNIFLLLAQTNSLTMKHQQTCFLVAVVNLLFEL